MTHDRVAARKVIRQQSARRAEFCRQVGFSASFFRFLEAHGLLFPRPSVGETKTLGLLPTDEKLAKVPLTALSLGVRSRLEYRVTLPHSGEHRLTARVVTVNAGQRLNVSANGVGSGIPMEMPFTVGEWQESEPVALTLKEGENVLRFWRDQPPQCGLAIMEFALTPAKERDGRLDITEALQKRSGA